MRAPEFKMDYVLLHLNYTMHGVYDACNNKVVFLCVSSDFKHFKNKSILSTKKSGQ